MWVFLYISLAGKFAWKIIYRLYESEFKIYERQILACRSRIPGYEIFSGAIGEAMRLVVGLPNSIHEALELLIVRISP